MVAAVRYLSEVSSNNNKTKEKEKEKTHCSPTTPSRRLQAVVTGSGTTGNAIAEPTSRSCNTVLTLEMSVGFTSAEGMEKSQYRAIVFGGGREIHR